MYVCICNGYRERDLKELAESGVRTADHAYRCLGSGPQCGRCLEVAQRVLDRHGNCETSAEPFGAPALNAQLAV